MLAQSNISKLFYDDILSKICFLKNHTCVEFHADFRSIICMLMTVISNPDNVSGAHTNAETVAMQCSNLLELKTAVLPLNSARYNTQIARFMGPSWGPPGSCRTQMGPILAPWTLLSGNVNGIISRSHLNKCYRQSRAVISFAWIIPSHEPPEIGKYVQRVSH